MNRPARYDQIADLYVDTVGDDVSDPATAALFDLLGDVKGWRVLDLACGHGRVARELANRGATVVGIDLSSRLLDKARAIERQKPLRVLYVQADAASPNALAGEVFDAVSCNFGLSDIDDLQATLHTVHRVLRPNGRFVFSLLHPCFPGSGDDAPSSWPPEGYFHEGWGLATNPGFRGRVGSNFRMLSTYLNALVGSGFSFDRAFEPPPAPSSAGTPLGAPLPWFLVVRALRNA
jgi:SAM-dependent methyltransferase